MKATKVSEVNKELKEMNSRNGFHYVDNADIDGSCLNGSKLHLNSRGSAYSATCFIKFLRPPGSKAKRTKGLALSIRGVASIYARTPERTAEIWKKNFSTIPL